MLHSITCTTLDALGGTSERMELGLLFTSLVADKYTNNLLYGVPKNRLGKLQRRHHVAARIVVRRGKFCHITPVLHQLHWITALFRINVNSLLLAFKAIHCITSATLLK